MDQAQGTQVLVGCGPAPVDGQFLARARYVWRDRIVRPVGKLKL